MARSNSKLHKRKQAKTRRGDLMREYAKYFVPQKNAVDRNSNTSLEQPSIFKPVPTTVTYGVADFSTVISQNA